MFNTFGGIPSTNQAQEGESIYDMLAKRLVSMNQSAQRTQPQSYNASGWNSNGMAEEGSAHTIRGQWDPRKRWTGNPIEQKIISNMLRELMAQNTQQAAPEETPKIPWADMSNLAPEVQPGSLPGAARAWSGAPTSYTMFGGN